MYLSFYRYIHVFAFHLYPFFKAKELFKKSTFVLNHSQHFSQVKVSWVWGTLFSILHRENRMIINITKACLGGDSFNNTNAKSLKGRLIAFLIINSIYDCINFKFAKTKGNSSSNERLFCHEIKKMTSYNIFFERSIEIHFYNPITVFFHLVILYLLINQLSLHSVFFPKNNIARPQMLFCKIHKNSPFFKYFI